MDKLKVGMMTTWNTQCGIAEYSRYLTDALRRRDDIDLIVLGSKNYGARKVAEDESYVRPSFAVLPWNEVGDHSFDVDAILEMALDVLHIQYEVLLYNQDGLYDLLRRFKGLKVITYHDNCIPADFPYPVFDLAYTHREDVGVGQGYLLPFGIDNRPPVVKTFGLGRSRNDIIGEVCRRNGWSFEYSFGEQEWKTTAELHRWLRDSDAIVLYYDDVPSAGSSQAARTAIGTRRPVIVNNVTWFKGVEGVYEVVNNPQELEYALQQLLVAPVIEEYSWDNIADGIVMDYKGNLCTLA
jgi:hypothetical protein